MASNSSMAQLNALVWLKWRLFRNALRSRRGAANRIASMLGTLSALTLALLVATGLGFAAYTVMTHAGGGRGLRVSAAAEERAGALFVLFGMAAVIYLMWATVPLSLGGGSQFNPGRLLLYPISLRKLFLIDMLSELTSLASIFAAPSVFAIALGAGLATKQVLLALLIALCALAFGIALAKLLATSLGALMQTRRTRGEAMIAVIGAIGALSGVLIGQSAQLFERYRSFPQALVWTPPGAFAVALTSGLRAGGSRSYLIPLATLLMYALAATFCTYRIAQRSLQGGSGGQRQQNTSLHATAERGAAKAPGWQLPFMSAELSTVVEKELRYAMRNAQLRVMALMPLIMTFSFKLIGTRQSGHAHGWLAQAAPFLEGSRTALSVLYVFMITSALSCNLFAYDGGGMRTFVLAPVERRKILMGKNLAVLCVAVAFACIVVIVNGLLYRDVTPRALLFAALCFVFFAGAFACVGNWFSLRYPKRLEYGKRMNASGVAGLLLLPIFLALAVPPALAVLAGYLARSLFVEYVILASFACVGVASYALLIKRQGRLLAARELDILEAVTGRSGE